MTQDYLDDIIDQVVAPSRKKPARPSPTPANGSDGLDSIIDEVMSGGRRPQPSPTPTPEPEPTPLPRPRSSTPAYIPPTERQEFNYRRPLDLDTSLRRSHQRQVGRQLAGEAALARTPVTLRPDWRTPASFEDANRRISDIVADPAKMAALPPEQRQFLQGTADYERRSLTPAPKPKPVELTPPAKPFTMRRIDDFDATDADRNILLTAADPAKLAALSPESRRAIEDTAALIVKRDQEEQFQGRISQLVAQRAAKAAAEKKALSDLADDSILEQIPSRLLQAGLLLSSDDEANLRRRIVELSNRFLRGAAGAGAGELRGLSLLGADPNVQQAFAPESVERLLSQTLPVDAAHSEGLLDKGVEGVGSTVPFLMGSAAGGAAGFPGWFAPLVLGAAGNAGETYDDAIAAGADPERAKRAAILGALIGMTEAVGVGRFGAKAPGVLAAARHGGLRELGLEFGKEFSEEAVQGGFSRVLNNVNAKIVSGYDPKRAIGEGLAEEVLMGGGVGGFLGGGTHLAGMGLSIPGRLAERRGERAAGAEAVRSEPFAPLDLTPTTLGPINLISLREAAKPEFRKRLEEATKPPAETMPAPTEATPAATAPAEAAAADPLAAAVQQLMSLRRPTEAETKQAAKEAKEQKKEAEKQAKQASKEAEKQAKQAEKESGKQAKLDERAALEAEGELKRMRLYDESVDAARQASEEADTMIDAGDYSGAIGKLRAQQSALGQSVKYLPETPEAVKTKTNVATILEGIGQRIPDLRKQALAARQGAGAGAETEAALKPSKAGQADEERRRRSETGERLAERYRSEARRKYEAGDLLGAHAAYRASLQALNDVMKITPAAEFGRRTQLRNAITAVETELSGVSGELKKGKPRTNEASKRPQNVEPAGLAVDENAPTRELPATPLLDQVNNPEGGIPPRTEPVSGVFGRLARRQEAEREATPQSRRKDTGVLSPVEYLKRKTSGEGIRVSDRGEAAMLGSKEAGIVGLTNRGSKWTLADAQVMLDEGGFTLDDGRRFTDPSVTENDVLQFLQESGKEGRLDTAGISRRLAEEEAEYYANLPSAPLEAPEGRAETAPLSERSIAPESAEARPIQEATPARRPTERRFVPKATAENIEELRDRRDVLSRLRYDRPGELTQDLNDEYRELGSRIAEFEAGQAKAARGGRPELGPPLGAPTDDRPFRPPSREDLAGAFETAEARLEEESKRASEVLPKSDTELLERGRAAVDALFADIEQDVDALDLLDRAIEGDSDARDELIHFAERIHGVDADTVGSIIDARRSGREQERGRIRQIAQARAGAGRTETGAPRHGADRQTVETGPPPAREVSSQDLDLLNREPAEVADEGFDQHLQSLEQLNNDRIRGLVDMPEWAARQLEARLKQTNEIRRGLVKEKRLGRKHEPLPRKGGPPTKAETGRLAEQARLARAVGDSPSDESKVKVGALGLESKTAPSRPADAVSSQRNISIDDITLGRDDLSRGRMNQVQTALAGGVKPERKGVPLREQVDAIEVVPDPDRLGKWIVDNDGNHRVAYLKLTGFKGDVPVTAWEAPAKKEEAKTVVHPNPAIDRQPILAETNRGTVLVPNPANKTGVSEVKDRGDEPAEYKFSSTQVNLPKDVADEIIDFGKRIPDADLADDGREDEPHITVKFGLHGSDPKFAQEALASEGPVKVKFGKVSLFETNPDFDVVKVDVDSPDLHRLNEKVTESQPVTDTHPTYQPHATVAYVKKGKGAKYLGNNFLEGRTVTLDSVTFSGRDGERVEIPLAGKPKPSTGAIPAGAMPELNEPSAPPSPLAAKGREAPSAGRQSYVIPDEAMPELREKAKQGSGGTYMGFGLGSLQPLFNRPAPPKTTPYRQIADALGHEALKIDAASIADEAIDALAEAVSRGKAGSLPYARAVYWADKLKAKKVAGYLKNRQVEFITKGANLIQEVAKQSVAMDNAKRGSLAWEKAKRELDRARVKLSNHLSKAGEYDHPLQYAAKGYKASLLSAPHIPFFNVLAQAAQFPFHEAQKAIDFLVPSKVFNKWGIKYDKPPADITTWAPAMARELGAIASGAKSSFGDIKDMLWYGVTETGLDAEAARRLKGAETDATDKYELGNRPRLIPGLDQAIMAVGRIQGAADVPFYNVVFATALAAEADATARKIARDNPQLKLTKAQIKEIARDLAHDPSPAMIVAAADEADRFKLDYPTWGYKALQAIRNLPVDKFAGRHADATFKAALDFAIPFSKILLAAVDTALFRYSPAGMVRVGSRLQQARAAKARGEEFTGRFKTPEQFGRDTAELYRQSIVGTLAWVTLGLLGSMGYVAFTGGGEDDKRKNVGAVGEALGERFTPEMVVGDTAFDLGKLGPVGQAASMGARVAAAGKRRYDTEAEGLEGQDKRALRVFGAAKKGLLLDNPIGRAMTDISEEGGEEGFIRGKVRGVVPGLVRDVARMTDETKRVPDQTGVLGGLRGDLQSGLPSLRKQMQPKLDALGRPIEEPSPFSFMRSLRPDALLEDIRSLDVGLSKPQREQGESAKDYNERVRERGEQFRRTLGEIREDEDLRGASPDARRAVYEQSLKPQAMERAGKLSSGSVRVERQVEALRGDAYAALRSIPEYGRLSAKDQKAVRDLIGEELKRFKATASSVSRGRFRREKSARIPDWTPAELAKAAMEARE